MAAPLPARHSAARGAWAGSQARASGSRRRLRGPRDTRTWCSWLRDSQDGQVARVSLLRQPLGCLTSRETVNLAGHRNAVANKTLSEGSGAIPQLPSTAGPGPMASSHRPATGTEAPATGLSSGGSGGRARLAGGPAPQEPGVVEETQQAQRQCTEAGTHCALSGRLGCHLGLGKPSWPAALGVRNDAKCQEPKHHRRKRHVPLKPLTQNHWLRGQGCWQGLARPALRPQRRGNYISRRQAKARTAQRGNV